LLPVLFIACSTSKNITQNHALPDNPTTKATLWVQNAAEYASLSYQAYNTATRTLALPLEDSFWTASLTQKEAGKYSSLPPAIILDVDETVLDNSPFQARMIKQNTEYSIEAWNAWCLEAQANGIPGAAAFTSYAASKGVTIFFLTNREYEVEDATRKNLIAEGFPVSTQMDNIMSKGEEPGWNSSKIARRSQIEANYRVIMMFGDDLNDFLPAKGISQSRRDALVEENSDYFGRRWFILPNPLYGSWEKALYDYKDGLSEAEKSTTIYERLDTKN
jgi:acid phosphatase